MVLMTTDEKMKSPAEVTKSSIAEVEVGGRISIHLPFALDLMSPPGNDSGDNELNYIYIYIYIFLHSLFRSPIVPVYLSIFISAVYLYNSQACPIAKQSTKRSI